jgi:hypothetical protein
MAKRVLQIASRLEPIANELSALIPKKYVRIVDSAADSTALGQAWQEATCKTELAAWAVAELFGLLEERAKRADERTRAADAASDNLLDPNTGE